MESSLGSRGRCAPDLRASPGSVPLAHKRDDRPQNQKRRRGEGGRSDKDVGRARARPPLAVQCRPDDRRLGGDREPDSELMLELRIARRELALRRPYPRRSPRVDVGRAGLSDSGNHVQMGPDDDPVPVNRRGYPKPLVGRPINGRQLLLSSPAPRNPSVHVGCARVGTFVIVASGSDDDRIARDGEPLPEAIGGLGLARFELGHLAPDPFGTAGRAPFENVRRTCVGCDVVVLERPDDDCIARDPRGVAEPVIQGRIAGYELPRPAPAASASFEDIGRAGVGPPVVVAVGTDDDRISRDIQRLAEEAAGLGVVGD
jgi:hypothetical protein